MNNKDQTIKIIPLGGLGAIGQNMMVIEMGLDILIVDAGVIFPDNDMYGVEIGLPDISYLERNSNRVRAILITHGHEDHIGAIPYLLSRIDAPVYSSRLTRELISNKLNRTSLKSDPSLIVIEPDKPFDVGCFEIQFFRVCHSIPDSMGIAIQTPFGAIVHTGDFKIDHSPADGVTTDLAAIGRLAESGILLLLSDSTYAEIEGYTESESVMVETFDNLIENAKGRVIFATFASLISRIQQIIDASHRHRRKVAILGRSMNTNVKMALRMGYITDPGNVIVSIREIRKIPRSRAILIATGSQGEPQAAISRISEGIHPEIFILDDDTVVLSSSPIPGNETSVARAINNLLRLGAEVIYSRISTVHVHGHGYKEELKTMLSIANPRYFVPIHGEYRHLKAHAQIAEEMGLAKETTFIMENGDVLEIGDGWAKIAEPVKSGTVFMEGGNTWNASSNLLKERHQLSRQGVVSVSITIDRKEKRIVKHPEIISAGFQEREKAEQSLQSASKIVQKMLEDKECLVLNLEDVESEIIKCLSNYLFKETKKRPVIIPMVKFL